MEKMCALNRREDEDEKMKRDGNNRRPRFKPSNLLQQIRAGHICHVVMYIAVPREPHVKKIYCDYFNRGAAGLIQGKRGGESGNPVGN